MRKYTRSHEFRKIERTKSLKEWLVETEREKRRWGERKKKNWDKKGTRNKEHTIINKCVLFPRPRDTPLRWVCLKKKKKKSRALSISKCQRVSSVVTSKATSPASSHFLIIPLIISIFYRLLHVVYLQVSRPSLKYSIIWPEHQHGYLRPPSLNNLSFCFSNSEMQSALALKLPWCSTLFFSRVFVVLYG